MPATAELAKNHYCRSDQYATCARHMVAKVLGAPAVPDDLYPTQMDRVDALTKKAGH